MDEILYKGSKFCALLNRSFLVALYFLVVRSLQFECTFMWSVVLDVKWLRLNRLFLWMSQRLSFITVIMINATIFKTFKVGFRKGTYFTTLCNTQTHVHKEVLLSYTLRHFLYPYFSSVLYNFNSSYTISYLFLVFRKSSSKLISWPINKPQLVIWKALHL